MYINTRLPHTVFFFFLLKISVFVCSKCLRAERFFYNFPFLIFILFYDILLFFFLRYFTSQSLPPPSFRRHRHYYYHCYIVLRGTNNTHRLCIKCRNAGFITQTGISCKHHKFRTNVRVVTGNPFSVDFPGWFATSVRHDRTRTYGAPVLRPGRTRARRVALDTRSIRRFQRFYKRCRRFYYVIPRDPDAMVVFFFF